MYDDVKTGNSVAVFDDYPVLLYGIAQGNGLKTVTEKEAGNSYGFAVNKGQNAELLAVQRRAGQPEASGRVRRDPRHLPGRCDRRQADNTFWPVGQPSRS